MISTAVIFVLLASLILIPVAAFAQERGPTKEEIIEANYSGPVFLDAYWTSGSSSQSGTEVDVDPGDGASTLAVVLINRGPSDIAGITGRLSLPDGFQATGKAAGAPAVATFNEIVVVGDTFILFFDVDVLNTARVGEYTTQLSVDYSRYFETGTPRSVGTNIEFRVAGEAIVVVSRTLAAGSTNNQITAGKIEDYMFSVTNKGTAPITNVVVTLASPSESLKILGDSKWTVQRIEEDSQADLATTVFAADSLIGNPASFDVTVEYTSNGEPDTESFVFGTYVAGDISIRAYEVAIEYIGGEPNIVGNLLNEGNTVALFTTIEITDAGNLVSDLPTQQYLGDLEENSPLPFSIPVNLTPNAEPGSYTYTLKVTYKDDLRIQHEFVTAGTVVLQNQQAASQGSGQEQAGGLLLPVIISGIAAAAATTFAVIRRSKRRAKDIQNQLAR